MELGSSVIGTRFNCLWMWVQMCMVIGSILVGPGFKSYWAWVHSWHVDLLTVVDIQWGFVFSSKCCRFESPGFCWNNLWIWVQIFSGLWFNHRTRFNFIFSGVLGLCVAGSNLISSECLGSVIMVLGTLHLLL